MARGELTQVGEAALLLRPADPDDVPRLLRLVDAGADARVIDVVPGADSLLVVFVEPTTSGDRAWLGRVLADLDDQGDVGAANLRQPRPVHVVPVVYDGPDLAAVARHAALRPEDVVELHSSVEYRVAFVGFQPGFAYLSGLPERLRVPRLATPRPRVPAGSLGIGGEWTGIYPSASPGGWNLLGRTGLLLFDPASERPAMLAPGDRVRIVPS